MTLFHPIDLLCWCFSRALSCTRMSAPSRQTHSVSPANTRTLATLVVRQWLLLIFPCLYALLQFCVEIHNVCASCVRLIYWYTDYWSSYWCLFVPVACPVGRYGTDGLTCVDCSVNTYQNVTGQTACKPCLSNTMTETTAATSLSDCIRKLNSTDTTASIVSYHSVTN